MRVWLLKYAPVGMALYAMCVFGSATAIAQISAANNPEEGIWVKLCATGSQVFIPLSSLTGDEDPAPAGGGSKGCHACVNKRADDNGDVEVQDA